jgi:hypothetical protein
VRILRAVEKAAHAGVDKIQTKAVRYIPGSIRPALFVIR